MADPSASVSPQLLHHLHALSIMKYPTYQTLQPELLIEMLLKAPQVVQQYPFSWSMIESPLRGAVMLQWNPPQLGNACPSDGFIWADPVEMLYTIDVNNYPIEIYHYKAGFNPNNSQDGLFSRRRYRLKPHPQAPHETANIWLLHYIPADRQNQISIDNIPVTPQARSSFTARSYISQLLSTGQLPRKEFYLHDRSSWPVITLPPQQPHHQQIALQPQQVVGQPVTPQTNRHISPMNARSTPQTPQAPAGPPGYYPAVVRPAPNAAGTAPPSAKRLKPTPPTPHSAAAAQAQAAALGVGPDPAMTIDEEEDTSRGDMLDHLTAREIATTRYIQHHEWMEEVLGSAYSISQIKPVDLGLGLRGELESVTKGLLDPPVHPHPKSRVGENVAEEQNEERDQRKILEEFAPRVDAKIKETEDEIIRLETLHRRRLEKIRAGVVIKNAEKKLWGGLGLSLPEQSGDESEMVPEPSSPGSSIKSLETIMKEVEKALGRKIVDKSMVIRWELPVEEITKMGGVVAEEIQTVDSIMGDDSAPNNNNQASLPPVEEEFKLDPAMANTGEHGNTPEQLAADVAVEFPTTAEPLQMPLSAVEDSIMEDFMNVDDSKPGTPNAAAASATNEQKKADTPIPVAQVTPQNTTAETENPSTGERSREFDEIFDLTPTLSSDQMNTGNASSATEIPGLMGNANGIPGLDMLQSGEGGAGNQ
ncbi:hypothetical protein RUND412_006899 [Rhizina undulata]